MRRVVVMTIVLVALLAVAAGPVAAKKPIRGCPNPSFDQMAMEEFRELSLEVGVPAELLFTPEWEAGWDAYDRNGDGALCVKDLPDTPGTLDGWIFNVVDNTSNRG
jgi:hypothetical protein